MGDRPVEYSERSMGKSVGDLHGVGFNSGKLVVVH